MADVKDLILVAFAYILFERTFFNSYIAPASLYLVQKNVEDNGFEPLTPCVQGRCSSQLS